MVQCVSTIHVLNSGLLFLLITLDVTYLSTLVNKTRPMIVLNVSVHTFRRLSDEQGTVPLLGTIGSALILSFYSRKGPHAPAHGGTGRAQVVFVA